jgi:hypothetical protein
MSDVPFLDCYRIARDGGTCVLTIKDENGTELVVKLGPIEARALSDVLLITAAEMVRARQGARDIAENT